jgi:hypothetical protein
MVSVAPASWQGCRITVGLFLTTAQSIIALGIITIGDVFYSWLGAAP